jgi:DNA invertase Pin-like site-specific DNA recombinase
LDTSTPNGRLVFGIFAFIAEFERELIRGRVRSGLAAARARGKIIGRPGVAVDRCEIAALRNDGPSWPKIAAKLGVWEGTVFRAGQASSKTLSENEAVTVFESAAD